MHSSDETMSRRQLLGAGAGFLAASAVMASAAPGETRPAPSERINVGFVGLGSRGFDLLHGFLRQSDVQVVAVCDVDSRHYRDKEWGEGSAYGLEPAREAVKKHYAQVNDQAVFEGVEVFADFRELCALESVDTVVVATPDHWHALCTLEALRRGKDVYCEKPVTHFFAEGQAVYGEVAKRKAVFQAGSQQRSDERFRHAVELVLNGHIGTVKKVEVGLPMGYGAPQGDATAGPPPEHLDYDFWCGPSPKLPYMRARHHRWWRGHRAYGGGVLMDFIGHHNDIAHWGLGMDGSGPERVEAVQWEFPKTDIYNTPQHYTIRCEYPGGIETTISNRNRTGVKWIGEDGWIFVARGQVEASDARWTKKSFDTGPMKAYRSPDHIRNFLDCCRSREACVAPAETAHRSITPGHLGYVSHAVGRTLQWDAAGERIVDDGEADGLLRAMTCREPWELSA
jgi:predicted dehydrogenase